MTVVGRLMRLCSGLVLLGLSVSAAATTLNVAPVRVALAPGETSATVQVHNSGDRIAIMQARVFKWSQAQGTADQYDPTRSLVVTPAVFSIGPGQVQVLRVGVRTATDDNAVEQAYRLLLKEVPPTKLGEGSGLRVALQIDMPIFVLPAPAPTVDAKWHAERTGSNALQLTVENQGNAHLQVTQLNLSAGGEALGLTDSAPSLMYILPGQSRTWSLTTQKPLPATGQTIDIAAETDRGSRQEKITLGSSNG